ncbi:MAG: cobalt-precorrin-5B (C(1))-methyltransferase, partial [Synechococcaceae bacterium WBB_3_034]|nr:cobalt-precorrin-5B (C(1))-methyltransferase [Synechococcaceae bacterium WBB_3_034]
MADRGFTLPVWLAAAAVAAVDQLRQQPFDPRPLLQLRPDDPTAAAEPVPVEAAALLG